MINNLILGINNFFQENVLGYINSLYEYPIKLVLLVIDLSIVIFLAMQLIKIAKDVFFKSLAIFIILTINSIKLYFY